MASLVFISVNIVGTKTNSYLITALFCLSQTFLAISSVIRFCIFVTKQFFQEPILKIFIFILCELVFFLHVCLCEVVGSLGTDVTVSCEPPCRLWELNLGPLDEMSVILTTEPSFQPLKHFLKNSIIRCWVRFKC